MFLGHQIYRFVSTSITNLIALCCVIGLFNTKILGNEAMHDWLFPKYNSHEHFGSLPSAHSFEKAVFRASGLSVQNIPFQALLKERMRSNTRSGEPHIHLIKNIFGSEASVKPSLWMNLKNDTHPLTIGDVTRHIAKRHRHRGATNKNVNTSLLSFFHDDLWSAPDPFLKQIDRDLSVTYRQIEDIRKDILRYISRQALDPQSHVPKTAVSDIIALAHIYMRIELHDGFPLTNVPDLNMTSTVNRSFIDEKLAMVSEDMMSLGVPTTNLFSYARWRLAKDTEEVFQAKLNRIEAGLRGGWIDGVDISGGISAGKDGDNGSKDIYLNRIRRIAFVINKHSNSKNSTSQGILKFHAWETDREGPYYDAIWTAFEQWTNNSFEDDHPPSKIIIGHIASILDHPSKLNGTSPNDEEQTARRLGHYATLLSDRNSLLSADCAAGVYHLLHGLPYEHILRTIQTLNKYGIAVNLGTDGLGILGPEALIWLQVHNLSQAKWL